MEPSRDNPFVRFSAFWLGLGIFLAFALILGVLALLFRGKKTNLEDELAKARYETRQKVDAAQITTLSPEAIEKAIPQVAQTLAASKPAAVETPAQAVPGTPTAAKIAAAAPPPPPEEKKPEGTAPPAATPPAPAPPAEQPAPVPQNNPEQPAASPAPDTTSFDPAVMEAGRAQFLLCSACHGQEGEGGGAGPPIAGSEWITGPVENLIRIQLRGLVGPITVKGTKHDFPGGMAPMPFQTDEQIAAVLTYARNSFGNKASAVKPEQVAALRSEVGKPQLTADQLILP